VLSTYQQRVLILDPDGQLVEQDIVFGDSQWISVMTHDAVPVTAKDMRWEEPSVVLWGSEYKLSHGGLTRIDNQTTLVMPNQGSVFRPEYAYYYMQALQDGQGLLLSSPSSDAMMAFSGDQCATAVPIGVSLDSWLIGGSVFGPQDTDPSDWFFSWAGAVLLGLDTLREASGVVAEEGLRAALYPSSTPAEFHEMVGKTVHSGPGSAVLQSLLTCEGGGCTTGAVRAQVAEYLQGHVGSAPLVDIGEAAYLVLKSGYCRAEGPVVGFALGTSVAGEGGAQVPITISLSTRSGPLATAVNVDWSTANGAALAGSDFIAASGRVTFPAGTTNGASRTVMVSLLDDSLDEDDETFFVRVTSVRNAALASISPHAVKIVDDDPMPSISVIDVAVPEGQAGLTSAMFGLRLSAPSGRPVAVSWATRDGSASQGTDYVEGSGSAVFAPGVTAIAVTVMVIGDTRPENDETMFLDLISPVNAGVQDGLAEGVLLDDDLHAVRVFVSVDGSDVNDCREPTTPCRTFDEAIVQVAAGGEVIVLRTGSYGGATITKGLAINVPAGVVAFAAAPFVVSASESDAVVLRGLTIKALTPGSGTGILFEAGAALFVERCILDGWERGIHFAGDGHLFVSETTIRSSTLAGLHIEPAALGRVAIDRSHVTGTVGGCGIDVGAGALASVRASVIDGNANGLCASSPTAELNVYGSLAAGNHADGVVTGGGAVRVGASSITGNGTGLNAQGGGVLESLTNSLVSGNGDDVAGTVVSVQGR
jgi:hypothetical protein